MPLLIKCSSPFAAPRHPHLRAPPHVCCHVCRAHARPCLSTGWALNRRFDQTFGTAAVLAQGGGGTFMCSGVLGCVLACWAPFCNHEGVGLPYVCNACSVVRAARFHGPVLTRRPCVSALLPPEPESGSC